jgi:hypothetical protein
MTDDDESDVRASEIAEEQVQVLAGRLLSRGGLTAGEAYAHARTQLGLELLWKGIGQLKTMVAALESRLDAIERALP